MLVIERVEISKEMYQELEVADRDIRDNAIAEIAINVGWHPAGYGFYGPRLEEIDGKYYAVWERGSSCD